MNYDHIIIIMLITFIIILFAGRLIMPQIARREIFFGVRIPPTLLHDIELNELKRAYFKNYLLVCGIYTLVFCAALAKTPSNTILVGGLIVFLLLSTWLYYTTHQRVKAFKNIHEDHQPQKQIVMIDTSFRNNKAKRILPSAAWFSIPLAIVVINIIAGFWVYEALPIVLPTHWNAQGMINGGVFKTYGVLFVLPCVQIYVCLFMFLLFRVIGLSKQQINAINPEESKERSRIFRYLWGCNIIFLNILIVLFITVMNLFILQIIPVIMPVLLFSQPLLIIFILLDILVMAVWTGQGGSRLHLEARKPEGGTYDGPEDDKYWIGGLVYFNPHDPALFVEKRFGIAWGLNYGSINAYILFASIIGSVFLLNFIIQSMLVY